MQEKIDRMLTRQIVWDRVSRQPVLFGSTVELDGVVFDADQTCYLEPGDTAETLAHRPEFSLHVDIGQPCPECAGLVAEGGHSTTCSLDPRGPMLIPRFDAIVTE